MSRRFQFSLGRLFACVSLLCLAALVSHSGHVEAARARCGNPAIMADMEAWVISGAAFGLLAKNQVIGVFLGIAAGIGSLVAFMVLLFWR